MTEPAISNRPPRMTVDAFLDWDAGIRLSHRDDVAATLALTSVDVELPLADFYRGLRFEAEPGTTDSVA